MLLYITEGNLPYRVTLVYSNRDRESTAFLDELLELGRAHENVQLVLTMTDDPGWDGETRRIGPELLRDHLDGDLAGYRYLLAGPPEMVEGVTEELRGAGIPDEQLSARALQRLLDASSDARDRETRSAATRFSFCSYSASASE